MKERVWERCGVEEEREKNERRPRTIGTDERGEPSKHQLPSTLPFSFSFYDGNNSNNSIIIIIVVAVLVIVQVSKTMDRFKSVGALNVVSACLSVGRQRHNSYRDTCGS